MHESTKNKIIEILSKEHYTVTGFIKRNVQYLCPKGHIRSVQGSDVISGHRCAICYRKQTGRVRNPRKKFQIGEISGQCQILADAGVKDGNVIVTVKSLLSGKTKNMQLSNFRRSPAFFSKEEWAEWKKKEDPDYFVKISKNGFKARIAKGLPPSGKISKYTYQKVIDIASGNELIFLNPGPLNEPVRSQAKSGIWHFKCRCGAEFSPALINIITGNTKTCGCTKSLTQTAINQYVESLGIKTEYSTRKVIPPREIDIWCPEINTAIEYTGIYWHSEQMARRSKFHLKEKVDECSQKSITLITIMEDEWLEDEDLVKAKLNFFLNKNLITVHASDCSVIANDDKISLIHNDIEVLAVEFSCKDDVIQATNLIINYKYKIIDGVKTILDKLRQSFTKILINSDNRWPLDRIYKEAGLKVLKQNDPKCYSIKGNSRIECKPEDVVKYRIWDCGSKTWIFE